MAALATAIGDEAAARRLERLGTAAHTQAPTMDDAARQAARSVRGVPIDTGRLERSIEALSSNAYGFEVGSKVPYARYVFHGTRHMAARPPKVPDNIGQRTARVLSASIVRS